MSDLFDGNWFRYGITLAVTAGAGAFEMLRRKIEGVERGASVSLDKLQIHQDSEMNKIWSALTDNQRDMASFRERVLSDMASKVDLNQMEARLMSAIMREQGHQK